MLSRAPLALALSLASLAACGDGASPFGPDGAPALDAALPDAYVPFVPKPSCTYLDGASDQIAMKCGGAWTTIALLTSDDPDCPPFYTSGGVNYASQAEAVALLDCDLACVYTPRIAAQFVYCGARGEYTGWAPDGPMQLAPAGVCDEIIYGESLAGAGWSDSLEAYQAAHPCPDLPD